MTIRVLLVDDQALLRATFRLLLEATQDMTVVGEASTGAEAIERPRGSGGCRPDGHPDAGHGRYRGHAAHHRGRGSLLDAIRTIAKGESLLSPAATTALIKRFLGQPIPRLDAELPLVDALTAREREVATLVAAGLSNEQIAEHLFISPSTAKTHVNRAMMKAGARDRAQLVVFAYEHGLLEPGRRDR